MLPHDNYLTKLTQWEEGIWAVINLGRIVIQQHTYHIETQWPMMRKLL